MNAKLMVLIIVLLVYIPIFAQIGINTTGNSPHSSAGLDVDFTNKGVLIPRMTQAQRNAIASPATSLLIYQTDNTPGFYYYDGSTWRLLGGYIAGTGINITGNVISNSAPDQTITISSGSGISVTGSYPNFTITNTGVTASCGSANYIPKTISSTSLGCSQIYDNGTGVGIGTTSPNSAKLVVQYSNTDIYGIHSSMPGYAIYGNAASGGGGRGVIGDGGECGVLGSYNSYISSNTWGRLGYYDATNYYGTYGYSYGSNSTNFNIGVRGRAGNNSNKNVGVFADVGSMSVGNYNYGLYADACGPSYVYGVYAKAHDAGTGKGYAVYADGQDYGVYAIAYANTSGNAAVYGKMSSGSGTNTYQGIRGESTASASSQDVRGVIGLGDGNNLSSTTAYGVKGHAQNAAIGYGVYGSVSGCTTGYAGYFYGNVHVNGTLSKSAGSFKIDHPLDPANKYLIHSFVESPDMKNVYDGIAILDQNGEAVVELPSYFEALNKDFRYQLTTIGGYAPVYIKSEINNNRFIIAGGYAGMKVSWQVTGIRKDPYAVAHPIVVEEEKKGREKGKYLHPELYNEPIEKSIDYQVCE
jgi:hypothetical protein